MQHNNNENKIILVFRDVDKIEKIKQNKNRYKMKERFETKIINLLLEIFLSK